MKFTILINQKQVHDAGLIGVTDLVDWAIIDYISKFYSSPDAKFFENHVWTNTKHLMNEMPLCKLNSKQAVSRRIKKIKDLGLITVRYDDENKLYTKITKKCFEITEFESEREGAMKTQQGGNQNATGGQSERNRGAMKTQQGGNENATLNKPVNNKPVVNLPEGNNTHTSSLAEETKTAEGEAPRISAKAQKEIEQKETIRTIFDYWKKTVGKQRAQLTESRKGKIKTLLKKRSAKDICLAIKGCSMSDYHMAGGYNDFSTIFKNDDTTDRHIETASRGMSLISTSARMPNRADPRRGATPSETLQNRLRVNPNANQPRPRR